MFAYLKRVRDEVVSDYLRILLRSQSSSMPETVDFVEERMMGLYRGGSMNFYPAHDCVCDTPYALCIVGDLKVLVWNISLGTFINQIGISADVPALRKID